MKAPEANPLLFENELLLTMNELVRFSYELSTIDNAPTADSEFMLFEKVFPVISTLWISKTYTTNVDTAVPNSLLLLKLQSYILICTSEVFAEMTTCCEYELSYEF